MTFNSLIQDLKFYVERGSASDTAFNTEAPRIVNRAERSLANALKIQGYQDVLTGRLTSQNQTFAKPTGWRNTVTFTIGTGAAPAYNTRRILRERSYEYMRMVAPDPTQYDTPTLYTDYDLDHWFLAPTPDAAYPVEIICYRLPDLLSASNQENYLTKYIPNLLLYQCLVHMGAFVKDPSMIPTWQGLLEQEFKQVNAEEIRKIVDRTQTRTSV
jgi:hypothetical protein